MHIDHLTIAGPTLAALLQSALAANRSCEGLLFGSISTTSTTQAHDSSEALVVEETTGRLTASIACAATRSFYSNSGAINDAALRSLLKAAGRTTTSSSSSSGGGGSGDGSSEAGRLDQLLGWFSFRPDTPSHPSLREAAVSQQLQQWLQAYAAHNSSNSSSSNVPAGLAPPLLFGLITSQPDHNNATLSLQYRFYSHTHQHSSSSGSSSIAAAAGNRNSASSSRGAQQQQQQHPNFTPVDLRVLNLGQFSSGSGHHQGVSGSSSGSRGGLQDMPALAAAVSGHECSSGSSGVLGSALGEKLLEASGSAAVAQLAAVQGLYDALLDELRLAAGQAAARQSELEQVRTRNAALRQQITTRQKQLLAAQQPLQEPGSSSGSSQPGGKTAAPAVVELL